MCGATLFADQSGSFSLPASLIICVKEKRPLPHLDYYLGFSNYVSVEKNRAYEELVKLGCTWSWDCLECKERLINLKREQVKAGMLKIELLHPCLKALL
jgi:hypothetical protein